MFSWFKHLFKKPKVELSTLHAIARKNFTYVRQDGEWKKSGRVFTVHDIHEPWSGDCDDWASSMCFYLGNGAEYLEITTDDGSSHAICRYKGWISDLQYYSVYPDDGSLKITFCCTSKAMKPIKGV